MSYLHAALLVVIILLIPLHRFARARWVPIVIAASFFGLLLLTLAFGLDAPLRAILVAEIEAGRGVQHVSETATLIKQGQLPERITAALSGIGLFATAWLWSGSPRPQSGN